MLKRTISILAAAACLAQVALTAQAAEIHRMAEKCQGQSCAWYLAEVQAPKGWAAHEKFSLNTRALALLPTKEKLGEADPLITVRTGANVQTVAPQARGSASVERLADIARADGNGVWQVYRIHNPARTGEEFELLALGSRSNAVQSFSFAVSVSANNFNTVEKAATAWREVLAQLEGPARPVAVASVR